MEKAYKKGDMLEAEIVDMDTDGLGIGKHEGYTLFVKDAVAGDVCRVKIMKAKKNYAYAHLEEILIPSSFRVAPKCPKAKACGGCQLQAVDYQKQLEFKYKKVLNNLIRIGGFEEKSLLETSERIMGMDEPFRYRNKAQYPVGFDIKTSDIVTGFYAGHTHSIIPVGDCLLGPEEYKDLIDAIIGWMKKNNVRAYSYEAKVRGVRHVLLRKGFKTGEIMVCLVISQGDVLKESAKESLIKTLTETNSAVKSISYSVNSDNTNVIMGDNFNTIYGSDTIEDYIGNLKFKISPLSFFQVNPFQTGKLYDKALEYADLSGGETVWDLYCGIGTISLFLAGKARRVYGIEIIKEAIDDARENARINNLSNATFFVGKAEEILPEFYANNDSDEAARNPDVIVVDPPRKGCDENCLNTMLQMKPGRIVYVSCDSATLSRDLRILCDGGYELKKWCACDQFPMTTHVETVCLLVLRNDVTHINIDVDVEELVQDKRG